MQSFRAAHIVLVIRVCDEAGNVIETHEHAGDFEEWWDLAFLISYVDAVAYYELRFEITS
jgi:hypothetical protein